MDLPGKNQRFDIDDLRHPSHYPDPNTNLLAPIRPRMPQLPIYKKYNAKPPENDFQAATPPQEKAIQVRPKVLLVTRMIRRLHLLPQDQQQKLTNALDFYRARVTFFPML